MQSYQGITRADCPRIFGYIDTYQNLARDNYQDFLDDDIPLQKLVKRYYMRKKINIFLFNSLFYLIPLLIYIGK